MGHIYRSKSHRTFPRASLSPSDPPWKISPSIGTFSPFSPSSIRCTRRRGLLRACRRGPVRHFHVDSASACRRMLLCTARGSSRRHLLQVCVELPPPSTFLPRDRPGLSRRTKTPRGVFCRARARASSLAHFVCVSELLLPRLEEAAGTGSIGLGRGPSCLRCTSHGEVSGTRRSPRSHPISGFPL